MCVAQVLLSRGRAVYSGPTTNLPALYTQRFGEPSVPPPHDLVEDTQRLTQCTNHAVCTFP